MKAKERIIFDDDAYLLTDSEREEFRRDNAQDLLNYYVRRDTPGFEDVPRDEFGQPDLGLSKEQVEGFASRLSDEQVDTFLNGLPDDDEKCFGSPAVEYADAVLGNVERASAVSLDSSFLETVKDSARNQEACIDGAVSSRIQENVAHSL